MRCGSASKATRIVNRTQDLPVLRSTQMPDERAGAGCDGHEVHPGVGVCDPGEGQQRRSAVVILFGPDSQAGTCVGASSNLKIGMLAAHAVQPLSNGPYPGDQDAIYSEESRGRTGY